MLTPKIWARVAPMGEERSNLLVKFTCTKDPAIASAFFETHKRLNYGIATTGTADDESQDDDKRLALSV